MVEETLKVELVEPSLEKLPKTALNALTLLKEELDNGMSLYQVFYSLFFLCTAKTDIEGLIKN